MIGNIWYSNRNGGKSRPRKTSAIIRDVKGEAAFLGFKVEPVVYSGRRSGKCAYCPADVENGAVTVDGSHAGCWLQSKRPPAPMHACEHCGSPVALEGFCGADCVRAYFATAEELKT